MANKKQSQSPTPITSHKHADKRTNIPTEELRDFVADEEKSPKTVLYPRDPSLDPQLVWKGKDEQDREDLAVPAVPIYIQEKIQPQAIIENVRAQALTLPSPKGRGESFQFNMFADFNGIAFEELVDFYHHEQNWTNRMILGDSLLVMTSLAEKEGLKGRVQMIYMDPPYGIKFGSNWQVSTRKRDVKDGKAEDATRQPEQIKAFRDTWQLGIHSYLAYLRDRLVVARELLTESGSVFVQIGDENVHLVRNVLDEVFGSENFVSQVHFVTTTSQTSQFVSTVTDNLLWYAKNKEQTKFKQIWTAKDYDIAVDSSFSRFEIDGLIVDAPDVAGQKARLVILDNLTSRSASITTTQPIILNGIQFIPRTGGWKTNVQGLTRLTSAGRLHPKGNSLLYKRYFDDFPFTPTTSLWRDTQSGGIGREVNIYVVQTNTKVSERCLLMTTDPGDLVLDPTCGSGTTAYVAEQWGRRWITVDTSRVAIALARTRLMAGRYPYYALADSYEGQKKERELSLTPTLTSALTPGPSPEGRGESSERGDIKKGFVYKRVPHVTLKSIANNEEIDAIHAKWQEELEPLRARINRAAEKEWEEWEVPRTLTPTLSQGEREKLEKLLAEYWELRRGRQKEIDASIAKRADTELLYDQPYEDNKRIRVSGPFTVESLSPHRVLSANEDQGAGEAQATADFAQMILENLRTAGVQNTVKNERLKFTRLEPFAGTWLHAVGEYEEKMPSPPSPQPSPEGRGGRVRRVAVTIGPEHSTVGPDLIKDAAKEAVQGIGFDLLVVCGFAFDPHVSEEIKRYGKLTVLPTRINPDLQMGSALLKNTGAGNLFMVFGEPDLDVKTLADGKLTVTIKGVDVYDPTTGEIRSSTTDDIACWFIDTNYNGESFFVRHAYFTGADEPYEKLKRALRAEIDEAAWSALYSTTSYPFEKPETGKMAVKVINHYGDEVLKVYEVG
jgi:adenine-specific DNA-methyltransferase